MSDLDEELDQLLTKYDENSSVFGERDNREFTKKAIKQAVEKYVIGEDGDAREYVRPDRDYPSIDLTQVYFNKLRAEQRIALWGSHV